MMGYNYKKYIDENEEIRCGFKVSKNRKKVRNVELGLLDELKKICEKYNIEYYAYGGTLLGAIRHKGYIPRDDDIDLVMFRKDYEKFLKVASNELPNNIKLRVYYLGFSKLVNIDTASFGDDNWRDESNMRGINIDIFPMDYGSKFMIINRIKIIILSFLRAVLISHKSESSINKMKEWQQFIMNICKPIFKKINFQKVYQLHEKISKKVLFKGNNIYAVDYLTCFLPSHIYSESHNVKFESTTITIPNGYDVHLKMLYGDYMLPVVWQGGHNTWISVNKSYKDIIKTFDRSKSNEVNYKNCKSLFLL